MNNQPQPQNGQHQGQPQQNNFQQGQSQNQNLNPSGQPPQQQGRQQQPPQQHRQQGGQPQQPQGQQQGYGARGNLKNLASYSFKGGSLLEVSLVHEAQTNEFKSPFFCFLKLIPGGKNQATGERTYIPDNQICMKLSIDKIFEFAKALKAHASGHAAHFGPYSTFTDTRKAAMTSENTNSGTKSVFMSQIPGQKNAEGQFIRNQEPKVMLMATFQPVGGQKKDVKFPMTPYMASSIADIAEKIAHKGCELDMERQIRKARGQQ